MIIDLSELEILSLAEIEGRITEITDPPLMYKEGLKILNKRILERL